MDSSSGIDRRSLLSVAAALACMPAFAQPRDYPNRPIRIIVPYAAGGSVDVVARILGQRMEQALGQPLVIDNRPGASGMIGLEAAVKSPPDGYTFVICTVGALTINAHLNKLSYDPLTDLLPVSRLVTSALMITANPSFPVKSIPELIAYAKQRPGALSYSVTGNTSQTFLAGKMLEGQSGLKMVAVPYKGGAPAATAIASGEVPFGITDTGAILPFLRSGKVRALAVTYPKRAGSMPDVPAVAETLPGFEVTTWIGMFAPAGTPAEIVAKVNAAVGKVLADPAVQESIAKTEQDTAPSSSAQLAAALQADYKSYGQILRDAGINKQ